MERYSAKLTHIIGRIMDNDETVLRQGDYPRFRYTGNIERMLNLARRHLGDHPNLQAVLGRPQVTFSLNPPFSIEEFRSKTLSIANIWKGQAGEHEMSGSDPGAISCLPVFDLPGFVDLRKGRRNDVLCFDKDYCLVAYLDRVKEPIGHIWFTVDCAVYPDKRVASLMVSVNLIWISPQYRGLGFGANLGIIGGEITSRKYRDLSRLLGPTWTIKAGVTADCASLGGEAVVKRLFNEMNWVQKFINTRRGYRHAIALPVVLETSPINT